MRGAFAGAVKRAELPEDLNQHDLRHRRVTTWLAAGKSPVLVQKAMGHSDLQTTMKYTHLVSDDLLALVEDPEERALRELADAWIHIEARGLVDPPSGLFLRPPVPILCPSCAHSGHSDLWKRLR